jgi:hypothetical protein
MPLLFLRIHESCVSQCGPRLPREPSRDNLLFLCCRPLWLRTTLRASTITLFLSTTIFSACISTSHAYLLSFFFPLDDSRLFVGHNICTSILQYAPSRCTLEIPSLPLPPTWPCSVDQLRNWLLIIFLAILIHVALLWTWVIVVFLILGCPTIVLLQWLNKISPLEENVD